MRVIPVAMLVDAQPVVSVVFILTNQTEFTERHEWLPHHVLE